jgi:hypothetical protein
VTSRERLLCALHGERPDRLPWAPEFNIRFCDRILAEIPGQPYAADTQYIEACRRMRAECLLRVDVVESEHPNVRMHEVEEDGLIVRTWETPRGTLTSRGRMMDDIGVEMESEHMVKTVDDVHAYRFAYEEAVFHPRYGAAERQIENMGDAGLITLFGPPTPLLDLIMFQIRLPTIHYLMADHPQEMAGLLEAMHRRNCEFYEIAAAAPGEVVRSFEDTSTTLISPALYREWCLRQLQDYRDICHARGKLFVPHMCGYLRGVLDDLRETGVDGIEAITPPPLGDTPLALAREALGPEVTLIGGIDPTQFVGATPEKTRDLVEAALSGLDDTRRTVLGHEEVHIKADFESVRAIPDVLDELTG